MRCVVLRRALRRAGISLSGATVLDVGAGTGFYVKRWLELGAAEVTGIDLSATAVEALRAEYPTAEFRRDDIAELSDATRAPGTTLSLRSMCCSTSSMMRASFARSGTSASSSDRAATCCSRTTSSMVLRFAGDTR